MACALSLPFLPIGFRVGSSEKHYLRPSTSQKICFSLEAENHKQQRGGAIGSTTADDFVISDFRPPPLRPVKENVSLPLVSAIKDWVEKDTAPFTFPGHNRGRAAPSELTDLIGTLPFLNDLSPFPALEGVVLDAENKAAKVFGSSRTWFLVGGTTSGIQAAIMATCFPGDFLILARNSHIAAISAMVLSGAQPKYIIPEYNSEWEVPGGITPLQVENAIKELEMKYDRLPAAVFVTSPTYHGICSDLRGIKSVCDLHGGIPLIVDEAHGAHLRFHRDLLANSAIAQGANIVVQSTHKVLCSLSQSSMLHLSENTVDRDKLSDKISRCLLLLQSTSPSYLLRASLDAARAQLEENPETVFDEAVEIAVEARILIRKISRVSLLGLQIFPNFMALDPLRVTVGVWKLGLSGYEADNILCQEFGVIAELVGTRSLTFVLNLGTSRKHVERLVSALEHLSATFSENSTTKDDDAGCDCAPFGDISISLSPRKAFFASKTRVSMEESLGKICAELICPYPPGIPLLFPGEIITEKALNYLLKAKEKGVALISGASDPSLSTLVVVSTE